VCCLVACREPGKPEGELRPAAGGKTYGGIYRVNETGELSSLDPVRINDVTSAHIAENVYDNLLSFDEHLQLTNELARDWEVSPDGLEYTYHLRTDVFFHDDPCFPAGKGRRLTAADVVYSLSRICDARTGSKSFDYLRGKVVGADEYFAETQEAERSGKAPRRTNPQGFEAINDSTFRIRLTKPFAPFRSYVALTSMAIHPREAVEYYGKQFAHHPVGTGPFRFVRWLPDRECVVERNQNYWKRDEHGNRLPFLDGVRFTFMKDDKMQLLEFQAGNLEESYRIPNEYFNVIVSPDNIPIGAFAKYTLLHVPAAATQYYGMLTTDAVMGDKRVRQAFNMAVDRDRIVRYILRGQAAGTGIHGLVPPALPGYNATAVRGYRYDPQKARELLAEAGWPQGRGFPPCTLQVNAGGGRNIAIAEAVQGMLKEVLNIDIALQQVEFATHLERIDAGKAPFYRLGWVADYPDPESFLNLLYGKNVPADGGISPLNSVRYRNPKFDELFERAIATVSDSARMELYRQAEQIAMDDAPMLVIFYDRDYRLVQPYVQDYRNNAMDRRMYKYVWLRSAGR
jgi:peptide/nickel transport system substrate-binding protein